MLNSITINEAVSWDAYIGLVIMVGINILSMSKTIYRVSLLRELLLNANTIFSFDRV